MPTLATPSATDLSPSTSPSSSSSNRYCCVMLGSGGVGKSALSIQYVQGVFVDVYDPTIMDSLLRMDTIEGRNITMTVVDTAGQDDYIDQTTPYIRMADVCVFVYSVTDATSIVHVSTMFDHALKARQGKGPMPFLVVGNKSDLQEHRQITVDQGRRLAVTLAGRMRLSGEEVLAVTQSPLFMETSAKHRDDAVLLFRSAVMTINKVRSTKSMSGLVRPPAVAVPTSLPGTTDDDEDSDSALEGSTTLANGLGVGAAERRTKGDDDPFAAVASGSTSNRPTVRSSAGVLSDDSDNDQPVLVLPQHASNEDSLSSSLRPASKPNSRLKQKPKKKKKKSSKSFGCIML
ncbi:ras-related GTP-binding protein, putative [Bodo saltans]|uniref:Ras-related GTP-binding protein, putative n=1 Tax=Bodo saltans TaxID=75058 RepID=A0A0S4IWG2_BODSA|nr:ras-related GTP-binding protein, putative [Bodo saltans]|eukprot:CUG06166.1 ras-related GTP-binding protein, putative [Bodo saltans]